MRKEKKNVMVTMALVYTCYLQPNQLWLNQFLTQDVKLQQQTLLDAGF